MTTGSADLTQHLVQIVSMANYYHLDERTSNTSFIVIDPVTDDFYEVSVRVMDKELMGSADTSFGTTRLDSIFGYLSVEDVVPDSGGGMESANDCSA